MEKAIKNVKSPLVMAHVDFNRGNILVDETLTNEYAHDIESIDPSIDIKFVDLDYSSYMYRGVDFGKYFSEWRIDVEPLIVVVDQFPSDKEMDIFLSAYRMECGKQFGDEWLENEVNSIERLRQESRVFALNAHLQDISIFLSIAYKEENLEKKKEILVSQNI
jgi:thiamine kinase-like enzyme